MMEEREPNENEALLPWHAAGTLSREDTAGIEAALAGDRELAHRYALVRDELAETVRLNEALGAPSPRPLHRLMTQIEAEAASGALLPLAAPGLPLRPGRARVEPVPGLPGRALPLRGSVPVP